MRLNHGHKKKAQSVLVLISLNAARSFAQKKAIGNTSKSTDECICNPVPVRDSYSEGGERKCLHVGRCFDSVLGALEIKWIAPFSEWS